MIQRRSQCVGAARYRPKICGVGGSGAGGDAVAVISTNPTDEKRGAKFCNSAWLTSASRFDASS